MEVTYPSALKSRATAEVTLQAIPLRSAGGVLCLCLLLVSWTDSGKPELNPVSVCISGRVPNPRLTRNNQETLVSPGGAQTDDSVLAAGGCIISS